MPNEQEYAGETPARHEGTLPDLEDTENLLREPITLGQLAEAISDAERRLRQEHAIKRAAFEERLTKQFEERWGQGLAQVAQLITDKLREHVHLETVEPEDIAP